MQADSTAACLQKLILRQGWIDLPATGTSMVPLIMEGNICRFVPFDSHRMRKGDIFLFNTSSGGLIAHRLWVIHRKQGAVHFLFKGDTNSGWDEPVLQDQLIGKLVSINRGNTSIQLSNFSMRIWGRFVVSFPACSRLLRSIMNKRIANF